MLTSLKKIIATSTAALLSIPLWVYGQETPVNPDIHDETPVNPGRTPGGGGVQLTNPLKSDSLTEFFSDLLEVVMVFAIPLIVFFIIFAGFQYVMARGNPAKIETANRALLFAVIGGVIILGAWAILEVISGTVDALGS